MGPNGPDTGHIVPNSNRALQFTGHLAFGGTVRVRVRDADRYGRVVGEVILPDGRDLSGELVKAGCAWWYRNYAPDDRVLERLEREAREARREPRRDTSPGPTLGMAEQAKAPSRARLDYTVAEGR